MESSKSNYQSSSGEIDIAQMRDYSWKYFSFHADQRTKTFNFFLIISGGLIAGFIAKIGNQDFVAAILGFLLCFMAFVFGRLEGRNRQLVKNAEAALKYLENLQCLNDGKSEPHALNLFIKDDFITSRLGKGFLWSIAPFSYSRVFSFVFWAFGILGLCAGLYCLWRAIF